MIESINKAFKSFSKRPFLFVWGSLMYMALLFATLFAAFGIALIYFIALSVFNVAFDPGALSSLAVFGAIIIVSVFLSGGLNAALARAYRSAIWKEKTSLTKFFAYALDKAPEMFGIMLIRDLIWLLLAGPGIAIYVFFLAGVDFMDVLIAMYVLFVTFVIHMLFTPAFVCAGALGTPLFSSMKHAFDFMRRRHIFFIALYALFAVVWALNFIPFVQFVTLFFAYPVLYAALIVMFEDSIKGEKELEEDEEE